MVEPTSIDISIFTALNGDGGRVLDWLMYYSSGKLTWLPLYGWLLWLAFRRLGTRGAIAFLVVCALMIACADQTATLCKRYLPKLRPTHYPLLEGELHTVYGYLGGMYGTISSHAANAAALTMLVGLTLRRGWLWWSLWAWVALLSYSRIYLGVHYPFDILLGVAEGTFWGVVWWLVLRKLLSLHFIIGESAARCRMT